MEPQIDCVCAHVLHLMNGRLCFKLLMRCAAGLTERFCSLLVRELFTGVTAPTGDFSAPMQIASMGPEQT